MYKKCQEIKGLDQTALCNVKLILNTGFKQTDFAQKENKIIHVPNMKEGTYLSPIIVNEDTPKQSSIIFLN